MRYLYKTVELFSENKLVLLAGPRQSGKTTLSKKWLKKHSGEYFNWDIPSDRAKILEKEFMAKHASGYIVLDEFHKYARWKSWIKGLFDRNAPALKVVVTSSARLDIFQRGGDSLLGRYELLHLHPYSIGELIHGNGVAPPEDWNKLDFQKPKFSTWERLEKFSGFPEPYLEQDPLQYRRWETRRRELLVREDLRELTQIRQISLVEHLSLLLPERVGSPLSLNSLREELQVAHDTIRIWISVLERLYYCFRISPYHKKISRSLKKEQKLYLWNWTEVKDPGARFENMVGSHLLKSIHFWNDRGYGSFELQYIRNKEKEEVDFVIIRDGKPIVLVEAKLGDLTPSSSLKSIAEEIGGNIVQIQLVRESGIDKKVGKVRIISAATFFSSLN